MKKLFKLLVLIMILTSCSEESELQKQSKEIYFYNWDMTGNKTMIVHNPVDPERISNYWAIIYKDFDTFEFKIFSLSSDEYSLLSIDGKKFVIDISEGGFFDSEKFDSNDQIRGHVRIEYY